MINIFKYITTPYGFTERDMWGRNGEHRNCYYHPIKHKLTRLNEAREYYKYIIG